MHPEPAEPLDDTPWLPASAGGVGVVTSWRRANGDHRLASAGSDMRVVVWDPRAGTLLASLVGHTAALWALAAWTDDLGVERLASCGEDLTIRIWDPDRATAVGTPLSGHAGWVVSLATWRTADGRRLLASASLDGTVRRWDAAAGQAFGEPLRHGAPVWAVRYWLAPEGEECLITTGDDGRILVWDLAAAKPVSRVLAVRPVGQWDLIAWSGPGGAGRLAAAGTDGVVSVWDLQSGQELAVLVGHSAAVRAMSVYEGRAGAVLVTAGADGAVRFWNPETGAVAREPLRGSSGWLPALTTWTQDDATVIIATTGEGGGIRQWNGDNGDAVGGLMAGHTSALWTVATWLGSDGAWRLAAAGDDATIRSWNVDTGAPVGKPLVLHTAPVWGLASWVGPAGVRMASAGDDAIVRIWDPEGAQPAGPALTGHSGWIPALTSWSSTEMRQCLASGGIDATIRIWDVLDEDSPLFVLTASDWVMCLAAWTHSDGRAMLASGQADGSVVTWDTVTGHRSIVIPGAHVGWVRSLTAWNGPAGPRMASAGFDNLVRLWNPQTGEPEGVPLTGHTDRVVKVIYWRDSDGHDRLVSGSDDKTIRVWDASTGQPVGSPLLGHTGGVWGLAQWSLPDGRSRLGSAGYDGTVRLWDLDERVQIRTIEVGPLTLWGLSDAPSRADYLGRGLLADAVASQLWRFDDTADGDAGPTVVSIEGPWGCGKTTLMEQIRSRLPPPAVAATSRRRQRPMTVREAVRLAAARPDRPNPPANPPIRRGVVTAWFNPWAHESGEQIWAGLTNEIVEAAASVLYPAANERERYWLARNMDRLDRFAIRRLLLRRVVSPVLGVALIAVIVPVALTLAELSWTIDVLGRRTPAATVAFVGIFLTFLIGALHTVARYWRAPAAHFLPGEVLHRPVADDLVINSSGGRTDTIPDPLRRARAGSLYLSQHDVNDLLVDLADTGNDMVIFVDDIDRCRTSTTAEVFEAVNLFLSGVITRPRMRTRFVIGLDPMVVAAHVEVTMGRLWNNAGSGVEEDAPGWAFLRKLVQLPVNVPVVSSAGLASFVGQVLVSPDRIVTKPTDPLAGRPMTPARQPSETPSRSHLPAEFMSSTAPIAAASSTTTRTIPWRSLEEHPEVRELVLARLDAQPDRSIREAKRMLNTWQLYLRVLAATEPIADPRAAIEQARHLILLAEIITRWPSLQRQLHRWHDGERGLHKLAQAVHDDDRWRSTVDAMWPEAGTGRTATALDTLRALLGTHDAVAIANLADRLL